MNKRIEELANQYGIKTHIDILELFANEVYGDGVKAGIDKEANTALRDYFASSAMQGLLSADPDVIWNYTACAEKLTPRQGLEEYKKGYAKAEDDLKREPLSDKEIAKGLLLTDVWHRYECFIAGVRFAEKHHGIGADDE